MNPPLAGINIVTGNKTELINIILKGYDNPGEINGESYQNVMPPHSWLTDQQIADVLTYIRKSWGNKADDVKVDEVKKVRGSMGKTGSK